MSFRFVGIALSILSTPGPSDHGVANGTARSLTVVVPAPLTGPKVVEVAPVPVPPAAPAPSPVTVAVSPQRPQESMIIGGAVQEEAAAMPQVGAAQPKETETAAPAEAGGWRIHLASYRSATRADQGWSELRHAVPAVLGTLTPSKVTITLKDKGRFVRLLAGPFDDQAAAEKACAALNEAHLYCHPLAPGHEAS